MLVFGWVSSAADFATSTHIDDDDAHDGDDGFRDDADDADDHGSSFLSVFWT